MSQIPTPESIARLCPDLPQKLIQDFLRSMDPEYFEDFPRPTIGKHLHLAHQLTFSQPCAFSIQPLQENQFELTLVAYDYFSEFATLCGTLSSFGLDIREAAIFTSMESSGKAPPPAKLSATLRGFGDFPRKRTTQGLSRKIVIDVFRVQTLKGFSFLEKDQEDFLHTLTDLLTLLQKNAIRQARRQVNRRLVETLGKLQKRPVDLVHPVHITFSNTTATPETILDIQATDTPAFLYTFANALAMRDVYIVKAKIEVDGHRVRNRFFVQDRHGRKIQTKAAQQELRTAAALLKEFTHYLSWAPDPGKALEHFDQFLDQLLEDPQKTSALTSLSKGSTLEHLAQLFGTSDYLWEDLLRRQHVNLLPMMNQYQKGALIRSKESLSKSLTQALTRVKTPSQKKAKLNEWKDQELFRIDMRHLIENSPLSDFSQALTNLADVILHETLAQSLKVLMPSRSPKSTPHMAIFGLGKLGGGELGYASDIEILFAYPREYTSKKGGVPTDFHERWAQEFVQWIEAKQEGIFRLDTRLRPHGEKGLLTNSFQEIQQYYAMEGGAAPFERQALIKLRFVAGDRKLGKAIEQHRDQFVYSPEPWDLQTALHLRDRQIHELAPAGQIHVKYGQGGLLDVEYTVQYLQLMHGHAHPSIRTPNTLEAIDQLCHASLLSMKEASILKDDYLFLRQLIDSLRIVRGHAQDLILPRSESDEMVFLARRLGMVSQDWVQGAKDFEYTCHTRMKNIHKRFLQRFQKNGPL